MRILVHTTRKVIFFKYFSEKKFSLFLLSSQKNSTYDPGNCNNCLFPEI